MNVVIFDGDPLPADRITLLLKEAARGSCVDNGLEISVVRTEDEFAEALARLAREKPSGARERFLFDAREGMHLLDLSRVCCFRSSNHRICAVMDDGTELYTKTIRQSAQHILSPLTEKGLFIQTFKSCFVNISHIRSFSPEGVWLLDGSELPISRKYYGGLLNKVRQSMPRLETDSTYRIMVCR